MDNSELKHWVAFNRIPRIGRVRFSLMEKHFGSLRNAWEAGVSGLKAAGLDSNPKSTEGMTMQQRNGR